MDRRLFVRAGATGAALALAGGAQALAAANVAPVASAAAAKSLPAKVLACYYTGWDAGTYRITDVPADFNAVYLFHAKPRGTPVNGNWNNVGNGAFEFEYVDAVPAAQVQACRGRGQRVILTVGGAAAGFNFDARAKSAEFVASFHAMHERLGGVDGCDFNNFEAQVGSSPAEMVWIASQLKSRHGSGFAITAPPQPNSPEDRALLKAMNDAGVLDWAGPQYYDWSGFNDPGFISRRTDDWVRDLGAGKVLLGLAANYGNGPSLADCLREWDTVRARYPDIRGAFCWSAQLNLAGGNVWGANMKARL
ncbi:MAG: hypothetical protein RIS88_711 [Pseudomonadota bacterium]